MHKIGFIDEEKSQINTFYQTFKHDFDIYEFKLPQKVEVDEIISDVFDNHLDALIIDYQMDGYFDFNGNLIVEKLNEINPFFPKILLTSHPLEALNFIDDANIVNTKDIWNNDQSLEIFIKKLNRLISTYHEKISDAEKEIKALEEKRKSQDLLPNEEDRYIELNNYLEKVLGRGMHLSRQFYSQETNNKLDSLIEKTERLLNKLSEKK